jgi:hypothetical protein
LRITYFRHHKASIKSQQDIKFRINVTSTKDFGKENNKLSYKVEKFYDCIETTQILAINHRKIGKRCFPLKIPCAMESFEHLEKSLNFMGFMYQ